MRNGFRALATIVIAACVTGCNSTKLISLEGNGQQRWTASDMVDAAVSDADRNRTDDLTGSLGRAGIVATGPIWTKVFLGDPLKSPVFTIQSAKLEMEFMALGNARRIHYIVEGSLAFEGRDYVVHAEGARASATASSPDDAISEAVQIGVVDAAHKVKFIITGGLKQGANSGLRSGGTSPEASRPPAVAMSPSSKAVASPAALDALCDMSSPVDKAECRGELILGMTTNEVMKILGKPDEMSADGTMVRYGDRYLSLDEKSRLVGITDRPPSGR